MSNIHPTAIVAPGAELGEGVEIGPYCIVGSDVRLGANTRLIGHVVVEGHTTVGEDCEVHPFARLGGRSQDLKYSGGITYVEIGDRTVLRECVTVHSGTKEGEVTRVGSGCLLMAYSHVAHGCTVGHKVIISNSTQLAGEVVIEDQATISGLVGIHQFCRVGTMSMVGGALKITQDVPPYMLIDGNKPVVYGINAVGLTRRGVGEDVRNALKLAYRLIYRSKIALADALKSIENDLPDMPELKHLVNFYRTTSRGVIR